MAIIRGPRKEIDIWPVLLIVIVGDRSNKDAAFIINLTIGISYISGGIVDVNIKNIIGSKILEALTGTGVGRATNIDKMVAGWGLKREFGLKIPNF